MPRFFIDSNDDDMLVEDDEGQEFRDLAAARDAAMMLFPDMARERLPDGDCRTFCISIRDERGATLYRNPKPGWRVEAGPAVSRRPDARSVILQEGLHPLESL
ncbi:DUF6894 family protein [Methylobacterium durans]|uniref:DUF6894 family protein n=1 Tax=Methylobacterium durans TaxID=2202825 RepID=UPI0013A54716|nr:hypothetical protein [Methylobacterium durans]